MALPTNPTAARIVDTGLDAIETKKVSHPMVCVSRNTKPMAGSPLRREPFEIWDHVWHVHRSPFDVQPERAVPACETLLSWFVTFWPKSKELPPVRDA